MIGRGQQNRGTGSMKSGYNLKFPRSGGSSNNWSARVVFTTKEAKKHLFYIQKLFFYENK